MLYKRLFALLLSVIALSEIAIKAVKEPWSDDEELTEDLVLSTGYFEEGERQAEHYFTYRPGGNVQPMLWYGSTLGDKLTFDEATVQVEAEGKRVIGGTNGDYYVISSGQPVGMIIRDGKLISSDGGNPALGFMPDGSAFFGNPSLRMALQIQGEEYRLAGINKPIRDADFFLYTADYGASTPCSSKTRNLILVPETDAALCIGGTFTLQVESNYWSAGAISIPKNRWVLCLTAASDIWRLNALDALTPGDTISLRIGAEDLRWSECTYASGSLYKLLTNGAVEENLDRIDSSRAPRTAVGILEDGSILFYTVDGRQSPYSAGLSLKETAERLLALGCVEAGALDGGGSTILHAQSAGENSDSVRSRPSLGRERDVSTFLFLVTDGDGSGQAHTLSVRSKAEALLCGGSVQFTAGICDEKGNPVRADRFQWSATAGEVNDTGHYIAPDTPGIVEITAKSGDLYGTRSLLIVDTPDAIQILSERTGKEVDRLELEPEETTDLTAAAVWGLLNIQAVDEDFTWECTGSAGSIDPSGRFTASANGGGGLITVSAGAMSMTIGVFVPTPFRCVDGFEQVSAGNTAGMRWLGNSDPDHVRYGCGSLQLEYDLSKGEASYPVTWNQREQAQYMYLWVYGDDSGNSLCCELDGKETLLTDLDYRGWRLLALDTGFGAVSRVWISGAGDGTIWLDQALVSNSPVSDLEPPILDLQVNGSRITASIQGESNIAGLHLTIDGQEADYRYDSASGVLKADCAEDTQLHRVTLTAWDQSGNFNKASFMVQGVADTPFIDMEQHWAKAYAAYLYRRGITAGRTNGDQLLFDPNAPVTRAEFAVFLCRWLGLTQIEVDPPAFADAADIPDWAEYSVYAVASEGLIRGVEADGSLWFKPMQALTRAQAAAILGRALEAGSPSADLVFPDAETIPDWAAPHVSRLAFLGVFSGFEDGTFRPDNTLTRAQAAKLITEMS